jgi:hypothetical protein
VTSPARELVNKVFVAVVTAMFLVWLVLLVDLVAQRRWFDVVLLLVVSVLVVVAFRTQRQHRPFTG